MTNQTERLSWMKCFLLLSLMLSNITIFTVNAEFKNIDSQGIVFDILVTFRESDKVKDEFRNDVEESLRKLNSIIKQEFDYHVSQINPSSRISLTFPKGLSIDDAHNISLLLEKYLNIQSAMPLYPAATSK